MQGVLRAEVGDVPVAPVIRAGPPERWAEVPTTPFIAAPPHWPPAPPR